MNQAALHEEIFTRISTLLSASLGMKKLNSLLVSGVAGAMGAVVL